MDVEGDPTSQADVPSEVEVEGSDQDMVDAGAQLDAGDADEGFYEEDEADELTAATPARRPAGSRSVAPTPLRTPKTPFKTPGRPLPSQTPRTVQKSAKQAKKKKKKPRKSHLDISALTNEQVALAALQSDQILHLKLRKRYYAEALNFIRQVEGAMETIGKLLGSTNKAEVLESIEFFRVAHEYQFESAEVCLIAFGSRTVF